MSNKLTKYTSLAAAIASVFMAGAANAGTLTATSGAVSAEATTATGGQNVWLGTGKADVNSFKVTPGTDYGDQDVVTITLVNGTFVSGPYSLVSPYGGGKASSAVPANLLNATGGNAGGSSISFRLTEAYDLSASGAMLLVSGGETGGSAPRVNVANVAQGTKVGAYAKVTNSSGSLNIDSAGSATSTTEVVKVFTEFTGGSSAATRTVDVTEGRLKFTTGAITQNFGIKLTERAFTAIQPNVALDTGDKVEIELLGDMEGIKSITLNNATKTAYTLDKTNDKATITVNANEFATSAAAAGANGYESIITTDSSTALETRTFKVNATLNFQSETDKSLASNATVGTWSVNGLTAKVSHLSLSVSDFLSWIKISNESSLDAEVTAKVTYRYGSTSGRTSSVSLGTAKAKDVTTISESAILSAAGLSDATGPIDVSIELEVAAVSDNIQIHVEKKSGTTRVSIPVSYKNDERTFFQ